MSANRAIPVLRRDAIEAAVEAIDLVPLMEAAFVDYSEGRAQASAVGELLFVEPPGEAHVKAASARGGDRFVVKVATGFYDNPKHGLPSSSGLMLLFDAATGAPHAILLDEGRLTDLRTAAAGAVAARRLAPKDPGAIAVLGAGVQARLQLAALRPVTTCRRVLVWARRRDAAERLVQEAGALGFEARAVDTANAAAREARLIVTTTPATDPLLGAADIAPGTHITAVGADTTEKGELAADLIARADRLVADSRLQARQRGELRRAPERAVVVELGEVIAGRAVGRGGGAEITLCDLTGIAPQDLAIAAAVAAALGHP